MLIGMFKRLFSKKTPGPTLPGGKSDDVIILHGATGRILRISDAIEDITGYGPKEVRGQLLSDLTPPTDRRPIALALSQSCLTGEPARLDFHLAHRDGHPIAVEIVCASDDVGYIRSVLRLKRPQTTAPAQTASWKTPPIDGLSPQDFVDIAHDLKTPLSSVIGFADVIRREAFGKIGHEKYKEYANLIYKSGEYIRQLVDDLLDLSQPGSRGYEITKTPSSLLDIAEAVVEICGISAEEAGLALTLDRDAPLDKIAIDTKSIKQILCNLVSNAIKFTKEGGVHIAIEQKSDAQCIHVRDTGIGLSAAQLDHLGDSGSISSTEGVRGERGSGLGIAVSKKLAALHGGMLTFRSVEGSGTLATLTLPKRVNMQLDCVTRRRHCHILDGLRPDEPRSEQASPDRSGANQVSEQPLPEQPLTEDPSSPMAELRAALARSLSRVDDVELPPRLPDKPFSTDNAEPSSTAEPAESTNEVHKMQAIIARDSTRIPACDKVFEEPLSRPEEKFSFTDHIIDPADTILTTLPDRVQPVDSPKYRKISS